PVFAAEVEHDWASHRRRLVEKILEPCRVIADSRVDTEPCAREEREASAHAVPDCADLALERRFQAERRDRRANIFDSIFVIEALPVIARDLYILGTEPEFDPGLEPPEQVRCEHHVSVFRPSIGDRAEMSVDPKDFLQHDQPGPGARRRQRHVCAKGPAVVGFNRDSLARHFVNSSADRSFWAPSFYTPRNRHASVPSFADREAG